MLKIKLAVIKKYALNQFYVNWNCFILCIWLYNFQLIRLEFSLIYVSIKLKWFTVSIVYKIGKHINVYAMKFKLQNSVRNVRAIVLFPISYFLYKLYLCKNQHKTKHIN